MKFGKHMHAPLRMNCHDFGDPLTFLLAPSSGQIFHLSNTLVYNQTIYCTYSVVKETLVNIIN